MGSTNRIKEWFVVGVDFGTTFTTVAFAHSSSPCSVKLVQTWPNCGTGNASAVKVPTVIRYTNARTRAYKWGYEVAGADPAENLRWFKLLFPDQPKTTLPDQPATPPPITPAHEAASKLQKLQISLVDLVSDFLKSVLEVTKANMEMTYGSKFVCDSKVEYILTVPEWWGDDAKSLLVKAAEGAGFGSHRRDFYLISELESSVQYTLKVTQPGNLKMGDILVVCDAGGRTVDLVAYKISNLEPLQLNEVVSGTGDLCGSVCLDQAFEKHIRAVVGDKVIDNMKPRAKHLMMKSWDETVKFPFSGSVDNVLVSSRRMSVRGVTNNADEYFVSVPGIRDNEDVNIEYGCYTIESDDVQEIFDPIVDQIVELVEQQVLRVKQMEESVAAILLVGGFGSSEYLRKRLQDTNFECNPNKLQVLQPPNSATSVVRGAILRGLECPKNIIRVSRRNYGTQSTTTRPQDYWDSEQNTWRSGYSAMGEHMAWDQKTATWKVKGHMNWFITKGMVVSENVLASIEISHTLPDPSVPGDFVFHTPVFSCDLSDPPDFMWQNPEAVYKFCTLSLDPSIVPLSKLKKTTNAQGESNYEVKYVLRMTPVDAVLRLDCQMDGEPCGQTLLKY